MFDDSRLFGTAFTEPVRDPIWRNILLPPSFLPVIEAPEFVQLSRILQLGPAHLVYPGATHTRRAHSIGVYEMARRQLSALASTGCLDGMDQASARAFLLAALCHDLGHFPYAHSLKELPLAEHEALTARIVTGSLSPFIRGAGADPELVAAIVDQDLPAPSADAPWLGLFRRLLSGVLDPDKLDYLNRDAWACGVPYGLQDVDFVLQHIGMGDDGRPGVDGRGVMAVEAVLFSKYQMYKAVYWHRGVRAATAMIKKAVVSALASGDLEPDALYGLDDAGFYALMEGRDRLGMIAAVKSGALMRCCLELPYEEALPAHAAAASLDSRADVETAITDALPADERGRSVIVDLPEPISFESDLPVLGSGGSFSESATVFRPEVVSSFTRSLRVLRVYTDGQPDRVALAARSILGPEA
ncbi:MAG: HD domain-containing protein [Spirochaetia bacterium]|nr:HD domain-containing protein [Spirochaetia bacterium]